MWFWLRGTSRREDRFASTHPLAPSSEKTTVAPIGLGTRGRLPRLPQAFGRITLASPNPQVGCTGKCEGGSKPVGREPLGLWPQQEVEGCGCRRRHGVLASWAPWLASWFLAEWGVREHLLLVWGPECSFSQDGEFTVWMQSEPGLYTDLYKDSWKTVNVFMSLGTTFLWLPASSTACQT